MARFERKDASLYYEIHGDGPWMVFAHGAGGNSLSWWQQVPVFAPRYRCLVYDQRGWGRHGPGVNPCRGAPGGRPPGRRYWIESIRAVRAAAESCAA